MSSLKFRSSLIFCGTRKWNEAETKSTTRRNLQIDLVKPGYSEPVKRQQRQWTQFSQITYIFYGKVRSTLHCGFMIIGRHIFRWPRRLAPPVCPEAHPPLTSTRQGWQVLWNLRGIKVDLNENKTFNFLHPWWKDIKMFIRSRTYYQT